MRLGQTLLLFIYADSFYRNLLEIWSMVLEKVIIVGPEQVHTYFSESYANEWDTQVSVERAADVWTGLSNGSLSQESNMVIFIDALFDEPGYEDEYAQVVEAVASFAPAALVIVMFYNTANQPRLAADVAAQQRSLGQPEIPFFSIDAASDVAEEINNAINYYVTQVVPYQNASPANSDGYETSPDTAVANDGYTQAGYVPDEQTYQEPQQEAVQSGGRKRGLIVASTSSKGGSGKTTVGMLTASMFYHASKAAVDQGLREKPLSVVIVDMDIRDGQIGFIIQKDRPTALNILTQNNQDDETILKHLVEAPGMGFHTLLAPKRARTADYLSPDFYVNVIDRLSYLFDVVVLDTSVDYTDVLLSRVVFPMANAILFVTNLSVGSVYGMNRWMDDVTTPVEQGGPGIAKNKIGVVVNQAGEDFGIDPELLRIATTGAEILTFIPMDNQAVIKASNSNKLYELLQYHPTISPAYYHIVKTLMPNEPLADPLINGYGGQGATPPVAPQDPAPFEQKRKRRLSFGK